MTLDKVIEDFLVDVMSGRRPRRVAIDDRDWGFVSTIQRLEDQRFETAVSHVEYPRPPIDG